MERRELLGSLGAFTGIAAFGSVTAIRADDKPRDHSHALDPKHEECMAACAKCAKICNLVGSHVLGHLGKQAEDQRQLVAAHALMMDCQAFCVLSATMIARSSELMMNSCQACAEACEKCAAACEKAPDDAAMRECAKACRECEKSCREMVHSTKGSSRSTSR